MAVVQSEAKWGAHADEALPNSRAPVNARRSNRAIESPTLEIAAELAEARGLLVVVASTDQELRQVLSDVLPKDGVMFVDTPDELLSRRMSKNCAVLIVEQTLSHSTFERLKSHLKESTPSLVTIMTGTGEHSSSLVSLLSAGHIDRFIVKPFKLGPTKSALRSALQQHRSLDQCAQAERSAMPDTPAVELGSHKLNGKDREKPKSKLKAVEHSQTEKEILQRASQVPAEATPQLTSQLLPSMEAARRFSISPWAIALAAMILAAVVLMHDWTGKNENPLVSESSSSSTFKPASPFNVEKSLAGYLAAAHRAFELGNYVEPQELSAEHFYSAALELDPTNVAARSGLDAVVDALIADCKQLIGADELLRAQSALDSIRRIQPNHRELTAISASLSNARQAERATLLAARASAKETPEPMEAATAKVKIVAPRVVSKASASVEPSVINSINKLGDGKRQAMIPAIDKPIEKSRTPVVDPVVGATSTRKLDQATANRSERTKDERSGEERSGEFAMLITPNVTAIHEKNLPAIPAEIEASSKPSTVVPSSTFAEPTLIKYVKPEYSASERSAGTEGWLDVHFLVTSEGRVVDARLEKPSLSVGLRRATLDAVSHWRYSSAPGAPDRPMTVRVYFKLDDRKRMLHGATRDLAS